MFYEYIYTQGMCVYKMGILLGKKKKKSLTYMYRYLSYFSVACFANTTIYFVGLRISPATYLKIVSESAHFPDNASRTLCNVYMYVCRYFSKKKILPFVKGGKTSYLGWGHVSMTPPPPTQMHKGAACVFPFSLEGGGGIFWRRGLMKISQESPGKGVFL